MAETRGMSLYEEATDQQLALRACDLVYARINQLISPEDFDRLMDHVCLATQLRSNLERNESDIRMEYLHCTVEEA